MAKHSLLRESWEETRQWILDHHRATTLGATALVLAVLSVALASTRDDGHRDASTELRADQSAISPQAATGAGRSDEGLISLPGPQGLKPLKGSQGLTEGKQTLRSGDGLHLYTGPIPDYKSGASRGTSSGGTSSGGASAEPSEDGTGASGTGGNGASGSPTTAPVNQSPSTTTVAPSAFAPNRVAFVSGGSTYTINPDGTDRQFVSPSAYHPAWAPSHNAIAVVDDDNPGGILSYVAPSGARYALTPRPRSNEGDSHPTWSPDGLRIAFSRIDFSDPAGYSSIWIVNKDGRNPHQVNVSGCVSSDPAWSPSGAQIAFWSSRDHCTSGDNIGDYELYVMNSNGTNVRRVGTAPNSGAPAFSPDGSKIAFASDRDGDWDVYVVNADGTGDAVQLTDVAGEDTDPAWSPNGSQIAFRSARSGGGVYVMNADGSSPRLLVSGASQPSWS